jgi:hypothetical protein
MPPGGWRTPISLQVRLLPREQIEPFNGEMTDFRGELEGAVALLDRPSLEDGAATAAAPETNGLTLPYAERLVVAGDGPVHVLDRDGEPLETLGAQCPDPRAWATTRRGLVLGCADGALQIVERERVTELGDVLTGSSPGRSHPDAVTLFDSTGLAIQDLAICLALLGAHRAGRVRPGTVRL